MRFKDLHLPTLEKKAGQAKIEFYSCFIMIQRLKIILMTFHLICIFYLLQWDDCHIAQKKVPLWHFFILFFIFYEKF